MGHGVYDRVLQVSQEGDLEVHTFRQGSWFSRVSGSASTISMADTTGLLPGALGEGLWLVQGKDF
jgi:hypothetical protein